MKLILHIGMGKTGTTSIQNALKSNTAALAEQKVHYLGMWFGMISPEFDEFQGANAFMRQTREIQESGSEKFVRYLENQAKTTGAETFILSNEAIFGNGENLEPFLNKLKDNVDVQFLTYMRDPHLWLPSAFTQWELNHKTHKGPLQPFPEQARKLIKVYGMFSFWAKSFPKNLIVRKHDTKINVVQDFAEFCGCQIAEANVRQLVRSEPTETLLRAAFNNRIPNEVLPNRFDASVFNPRRGITPLISFADLCFKYEEIPQIVSENQNIFEDIKNTLGEDFNFL